MVAVGRGSAPPTVGTTVDASELTAGVRAEKHVLGTGTVALTAAYQVIATLAATAGYHLLAPAFTMLFTSTANGTLSAKARVTYADNLTQECEITALTANTAGGVTVVQGDLSGILGLSGSLNAAAAGVKGVVGAFTDAPTKTIKKFEVLALHTVATDNASVTIVAREEINA